MKIFLIVLLLIFSTQSLTKADDIKDFKIEGISIGDSLLNYYSKKEIKNFHNYDNLPSDMKFRIADDYNSTFEQYDGLQFFYKPKDKNFTIYSISGGIFCESNNECEKILNTIKSDISNSLNKEFMKSKFTHSDDPSGKSIVIKYILKLKNGDIEITYTNWSKNVKYSDHVSVAVSTKESIKWTQNNYGAN